MFMYEVAVCTDGAAMEITNDEVWLGPRVPTAQEIVPLLLVHPTGSDPLIERPVGRVSVTETLCAMPGPLFVALSVIDVVPPDAIWSGLKLFVTSTSAEIGTGVVTVFVANVSVAPRPSVADTVAKLLSVLPLAVGRIRTWNETVTDSPGPITTGGVGGSDGRTVTVRDVGS